MGSSSDRELGEKAKALLDEFGVESEIRILSAHRNPKELEEYIEKSEAEVFIAIAGLSAALPGYIAARTVRPVIGVPREVKLGGLDALLSIAQMPRGVPVACVSIDGATNAALLAIEILALKDSELKRRLLEYRRRWSKR
ncbi:5-(carboxyamino)imidazole ribonucleotide mutase [Candidatus Bathyarchaeota archaeon]|nr:MAG: 5-(carboxyamino)imidazole ribonucleotide mutase [Candidatus Bathyarchaeota archaeon]RLI32661.1 MAG: 5-(carboxyamino)imidazole ribonucleotide mutase [Candidatus Bathyarchaeota archaeon]